MKTVSIAASAIAIMGAAALCATPSAAAVPQGMVLATQHDAAESPFVAQIRAKHRRHIRKRMTTPHAGVDPAGTRTSTDTIRRSGSDK
jgi:hypothetical protein